MSVPVGGGAGLSARPFFFGEGDDGDVAAVERSLRERGVLHSVGRGLETLDSRTRTMLDRELATVVGRLLDLDLADMLVAGWRTHKALGEAGQRSLATAPYGEELVELARHTVTSTHTPRVDLLLNGVRVTTVEVVITITFAVDALVAVVRSGRLVGIRSGHCLAKLVVVLEGVPVAARERDFDAPLLVRLGDGVPVTVR